MTDRNFSRAKNSAEERSFGAAPNLGKVTRSPQSAVRGRGRLRKRSKQKAQSNRTALLWTLLAAFALLTTMVILLVRHYREKSRLAAEAALMGEASGYLADAFAEGKTVNQPALEREDALAIVAAALSNRDIASAERLFILGEGTDAAQAARNLRTIAEAEGSIVDMSWLGQKFANGISIAEVVVTMQTGERTTNRLAQLVPCPDGKWRIDLRSYLRKSVPEWPVILGRASPESVVRVFIASDTYYNGIYSDDRIWQAYALVSPDVKDIIYAYAKRDSPQDRAMRKILSAEEEVHRATLAIRAHPDGGPRQFRISSVLAENWVLGDTPYDKNF
ncbi:hypothetical protein HZ994_12340 [Akkermansiaceae bacterium]|nr:hypothetical protein HZ994_12340 [Akkermansiaceae bacterium]